MVDEVEEPGTGVDLVAEVRSIPQYEAKKTASMSGQLKSHRKWRELGKILTVGLFPVQSSTHCRLKARKHNLARLVSARLFPRVVHHLEHRVHKRIHLHALPDAHVLRVEGPRELELEVDALVGRQEVQ